MDALKARSIKNYKSLLECPKITALVAAFDAKAFNDAELLKSYLAGRNRVNINFCRQANQKRHGLNISQSTWPSLFISFTSVFFLSVLKKQIHCTYSMCGGRNTLKHNVRTTLRLAYHGCKDVTHTSKTRQVKRPKWLQLLGSRFARLLLFHNATNRTQRNRRMEGCEV